MTPTGYTTPLFGAARKQDVRPGNLFTCEYEPDKVYEPRMPLSEVIPEGPPGFEDMAGLCTLYDLPVDVYERQGVNLIPAGESVLVLTDEGDEVHDIDLLV